MESIINKLLLIIAFIWTTAYGNSLAAKTYYIDPHGSDSNDGTSGRTPWADFAPVNARTFHAGDEILLKRGGIWYTQLTINGSGKADQFIRIGTYGKGERPKIQRSGNPADRCIRLNNPAYLLLSGIEVCNGGAGIVLFYDHSYHNRSVYITDVVAHDFKGLPAKLQGDRVSWSYGIGITGVEDTPNDQTRVLTDFKITHTEVYRTGAGIAIDWGNHHCVDGTQALSNKFAEIQYADLNIHDNTVDPISFVSLFITSTTNCTVRNSVIENGTKYAASGTGVIQVMYTKNVVLKNVTVNNTAFNSCPDNVAVDFECDNENPTIVDCTFKHNAGPAIEFLATPGNLKSATRNAVITNCTFIGNDWAGKQGGYQIAVVDWEKGQTPTAKILNNKYNNSKGTQFFGGTGNTTKIDLIGNLNMGDPEKKPEIIKDWKFDDPGNFQNWKNGAYSNGIGMLQVSHGLLRGVITGVDPSISWADPNGLRIDSATFLRIILKNSTAARYGQIYFLTAMDTIPDEKKHLDFWLFEDREKFHTYDIYMSTLKNWKGKLIQLRIDPEQGKSVGFFEIKQISLLRK